MKSNFNRKLSRIVQIVWLAIFAVCIFEIFNILNNKEGSADKDKLWVYILVMAVAFVRYFMLRRKQYMEAKKRQDA